MLGSYNHLLHNAHSKAVGDITKQQGPTKRRISRTGTVDSNASSVGTATSSSSDDSMKLPKYRPAFRYNLSVIVTDLRKSVEQPTARRPHHGHQRV
ncbi:hypothetical protein SDRG_08540 [Saprolegnia diclina VS20]|uniref:Uncharacterized protein n=1 Tax=Saprolegnia diclina (strain VS20) TaxID=1156394 RepID=T0Q7K8_SAPDV|nr:hypothetical protein SDRG_08540 [Saprolegnia diclina VS20]EQC33859.1 hypothetical protein SDRG_08540 [Saprolegnia diclina VS20]|eukprot:XP_008612654.1 hypothetical protein SDRG_08540 [Saprolegnia diclina VS20]